jgi:hypothetical protein
MNRRRIVRVGQGKTLRRSQAWRSWSSTLSQIIDGDAFVRLANIGNRFLLIGYLERLGRVDEETLCKRPNQSRALRTVSSAVTHAHLRMTIVAEK